MVLNLFSVSLKVVGSRFTASKRCSQSLDLSSWLPIAWPGEKSFFSELLSGE